MADDIRLRDVVVIDSHVDREIAGVVAVRPDEVLPEREIVFALPRAVGDLHVPLELRDDGEALPVEARRHVAPVLEVVGVIVEARPICRVAVKVDGVGVFVGDGAAVEELFAGRRVVDQ